MKLIVFDKTFLGPMCGVNPDYVVAVTNDGSEFTVIHLPDGKSIPVKTTVEEVLNKLNAK